jgi:hypothetical protein
MADTLALGQADAGIMKYRTIREHETVCFHPNSSNRRRCFLFRGEFSLSRMVLFLFFLFLC